MMTTASEKAAAFLMGNSTGDERPGTQRPATGEYARLRELVLSDDDLSDDDMEEMRELNAKYRAGTITGSPARTAYKRQSVAGEREGDNMGGGREPQTASERAAAHLLGRSS
jgi:hypothetical protein